MKNKTKNKVLTKKSRLCKSIICKAIGLMFSKKDPDLALVFDLVLERREYLHMFFVFYSIDLIFLDENKEVVEIKKEFRPFTLYFAKKSARYIVEVVAGLANVSIGDKLEF